MRALHRKLLRDLARMRGQALAIALVVAGGTSAFVASTSTYDSLRRSAAEYYERSRFADVFAALTRAPETRAAEIARIPGVAAVETRVVAAVVLDVAGVPEPVRGRLVSIPDTGEQVLNRLHLRRGRLPRPDAPEAAVSEAFAEANRLAPGDSVAAVINGRWQRLALTGIVLSPEYVFQAGPGDLLPDDRRFGVLWMPRRALEAALDMDGAFNDVVVALAPGASEPDVIAEVDRILAPYGGRGAVGRDRQPSAHILAQELEQLRTQGLAIPIVFLAVAAFLLNIVLARVVATERSQIALLKAFGYTDGAVTRHYLAFALVIVGAGALLGTVVGAWLGQSLTAYYERYFRFPALVYHLSPGAVLAGALVSAAAGLAGSLGAVRRVAALPPAEAMQPAAPARYRPLLVDRLGLGRLLSQPARMILRHLERRPLRAGLSALGIALALAIVVVGRAMGDAAEALLDTQFGLAQRDDVTITFREGMPPRVRYEVARLPGVLHAETFRTVPATLRAGPRSYRGAVTGLPSGATLRRVVDAKGRVVPLPAAGLLLGSTLAERLGVGPGDLVTVEAQEGRRHVREVAVSALVDDLVGMSAYMEARALDRLIPEPGLVSGAFLAVDERARPALYRRLKETPGVAGVSARVESIASFRRTVTETIRVLQVIEAAFAGIIAVGVVYNAARVSLAERSRELATLRVIGLTRGEISFILLGELAVLTALAIPLGLALGYGLTLLVFHAAHSDLARLPVTIRPATYATSVLFVVATAALSGLLVRRRLDRLDLVAVLKTRE
ncbi:MAG TPA: FtsX-like permease family protein [Thermodesulfobacteriota bacterium]